MNKQLKINFKDLIAAIIVAAFLGTAGGLLSAEHDKNPSAKPGEMKTVKGRIVPLYTFLTGQNVPAGAHQDRWQESSTDRLNRNQDRRQESSTDRLNRNQDRRQESSTDRLNRNQDRRQESSTDRLNRNQDRETQNEGRFDSTASRNQARGESSDDRERLRFSRSLGGSDSIDSVERENRFGDSAGQTGQWRAMNMNAGQPLALVSSDDRHFEVNKECYLLIFDSTDASSGRALLQAQRLARISGINMSDDFDESNQRDRINVRDSKEGENDRDRLQTRDKKQPGTPKGRLTEDSGDSNRGTDGSKQESYESRNDFFESDDSSTSERNASASRAGSDSTASGLDQEVSITGRVIEKNGVQALVVSSISQDAITPDRPKTKVEK